MKLFLIMPLFLLSTDSTGAISNRFCEVSKLWLDGKDQVKVCRNPGGTACYSTSNMGQAFCRGSDGTGCFSVKNLGQGICRAANGTGCYSIKNTASGICRAIGGAGCFSVDSDDEDKWKKRLKKACKI